MKHLLAVVLGIATLIFGTQTAFAEVERKLIVIPGIVGSELSNEAKEVIWGNAGSLRSKNFTQLNLLPKEGAAVPLVPSDAMRTVPLVFGTVNIGLYSGIIDFLVGKRSIFDSAARRQIKGQYVEGENLFVFAYDWRRSNFANAVLLNDYVKDNIPAGEDFDIVAHSMGGLLSRAFLSDLRPQDYCTDTAQSSDLSQDTQDAVCAAAYGSIGDGGWRGIGTDNRFSEAPRLHTFIEIATPHKGSVNVAATLVEGWGKLSQFLIGGKRDIQDVLLSMVGPYELVPSYQNCCANGTVGKGDFQAVAALDEDYWAHSVLGFSVEPCPYVQCDAKRAVLRLGLQNRAVMDAVIEQGLPDTVRANHVMIGRLVDGTREAMYIAHNATGDGDGISYLSSGRGDGTVYEGSALEDGNKAYVLRSKHPFIVGSDEVHRYVYSTLINPLETVPTLVNSERLFVGDGDVKSLTLTAEPQIVGTGEPVLLKLTLKADDAQNFDAFEIEETQIDFTVTGYGESAAAWSEPVTWDENQSFLGGGEAVFATSLPAPVDGVYLVTATHQGRVIAQEILHVLEDE